MKLEENGWDYWILLIIELEQNFFMLHSQFEIKFNLKSPQFPQIYNLPLLKNYNLNFPLNF